MFSPEDMPGGPKSWTEDPGEDFEGEAKQTELDERYQQSQEYVDHHLESASHDARETAMSFVNDSREDLERPEFIEAQLERAQLNGAEREQVLGFLEQLKRDRGWSEPTNEATDVAGEAISTEVEAGIGVTAETSAEAEPMVYEDTGAAAEAMRANSEAMAAELAALEAVEDDPYQTLKNFYAILDAHAVSMASSARPGEVIKGIPVSLAESSIPEDQYDEWGGTRESFNPHDKFTSGAISNLKATLNPEVVSKAGFRAEDVLQSYYHPAIINTLNRLFAK